VSIPPVERKLAAICAADMAGYRRLTAHDEVGTLARLKACRLIIDGLIATHRGRIFDTPGAASPPTSPARLTPSPGQWRCRTRSRRRTQRCPGRWFTDAGGLTMSYGVYRPDLNRRGADITQILKGANPGDIPFYQASWFEFVIKMKNSQGTRTDRAAIVAGTGRRGDRIR
jgi:hypothetical protein